MPISSQLTDRKIRDIADSDAIAARGIGYYRAGRVKSLKIVGKRVIASVSGNHGIYDVELFFNHGSIEGGCDCPYYGYGCKHMVAVLYKLLNEPELIAHMSGKAKKHPKTDGLLLITLEKICGLFEKIVILGACELLHASKVHILSLHDSGALIDVKDVRKERVSLQVSYQGGGIAVSCACTCNVGLNGQCVHSAGALLAVFVRKNRRKTLSSFEVKLREDVQTEKFNAFINAIESTSRISESQKRRYKFYFMLSKGANNFCMQVQKATLLKSGETGHISAASESDIRQHSKDFSAVKKEAFELFIISLRGSRFGMYGNGMLVKNEFKTELDSKLLRILKSAYLEDPDCFVNTSFPEQKGVLVISFNTISEKKYVLSVNVRLDSNTYNISGDNSLLFAGSQLWLCVSGSKKGTYLVFELEGGYPKLSRALMQHAGMEMTGVQMQGFIQKYYLTLSLAGEMSLPKEHQVEEITEKPVPRIFLKDYGTAFCIELRFLYGKHEVHPGALHDVVFRMSNGKCARIRRDRDEEARLSSLLQDAHVAEKEGVLIPSIDPYEWLADTAKMLISQGYEVYGAEKLFNQRIASGEPKLRIQISSGIDWFDIAGDVEVGKEKVPFDRLLDALKMHERFIKLSDGRMGVIPKKWAEKLSGVAGFFGYDKKKNRARASKAQIALVETLAEISHTVESDLEFRKMQQKFRSFREIAAVPLPRSLQGQLREYQKAGYYWLHFLKDFSCGGCLADEMGLGKTVQILSVLLYEQEQGISTPSLIVVPTSLIFNWENEIRKFAPSLKVHVHHGVGRDKENVAQRFRKCNVIITTYGTLRNDVEIFSRFRFNYIVLDESQQIKNPLSLGARAVLRLASNFRVALTGTPIENSSLDLWSQFAFLNPGFLGNMDYFRKTFARSVEKGKEDKIASLRGMVSPFILSRKKEVVAQELPEKQVMTLYCEMEESQRQIYEYWKAVFRDELKEIIKEKGFMESKMKILQGLTKLRQICNHPALVDESYAGDSGKFTVVASRIDEVIKSGHKVLVYSFFVKMLHIFREYCEKQGIRFSYLDGKTKNREGVVEEFQNDSDIRVFLISLKAGGLGLNLTAADYVFIVDPWWNPAAEMQAIDRAHRIGQKSKVFVYKVITKDSVEEKILELQESKHELVKNVISVEEGIFKKLSREDIGSIFNSKL